VSIASQGLRIVSLGAVPSPRGSIHGIAAASPEQT
jgi:hypothetical protein